ncbi:MAG: hypothetical protein ACFFE8_00790 [Candidatus Heimdallarchaeota archaeon]
MAANKAPRRAFQRFITAIIVFLLLVSLFPGETWISRSSSPMGQHKQKPLVTPVPNTGKRQIQSHQSNSNGDFTGFDIESLDEYMHTLYDSENGIFSETKDGFLTSTATYNGLAIIRYLGLDYYFYGSDWQNEESNIATKLTLDLKDEAESGGFRLTSDVNTPTLEGSFGVTTSLWIMDEPRLMEWAVGLLDFVYNKTFNRDTIRFHEVGQNASLKATFQALTILDLIRKIVIVPELFDATITPIVNQTVLDFMTNYSVDIFNFISSNRINNSFFYIPHPYGTPIEDTWYALRSIEILEYYSKIVGPPLPTALTTFEISTKNWLKTQIKTTGPTKGGFGDSEHATMAETGLGYAILNLFNATNEINHTNTVIFINSSQFLQRENRTYSESELNQVGGFAPNNLTFGVRQSNKLVNIYDTFYAVLTLLLSGNIFNSIDISLETSHFQNDPILNRSDFIIQGRTAELTQTFKIYNYESHGALSLRTTLDNWNTTDRDYTETNPAFVGKSEARYISNLENDSAGTFNWTLGNHGLTNMISIRNLPIIRAPVYLLNTSVFVGYLPNVKFTTSDIKPGDNVTTTIFVQNQSVLDFKTYNITTGTISVDLTTPDDIQTNVITSEPINVTTGAVSFFLNFSKQALLGTWKITITYTQAAFSFSVMALIEVTDTVFLYNISKLTEYYPGQVMNLNVSLKYTNGGFTPKANATLVFTSNSSNLKVFSLSLEFFEGNVYSTSGTCPTRLLYGWYNTSVHFTWNTSTSIQPTDARNESLSAVFIGGVPVLVPKSFQTDYRSLTLLKSNDIYVGEEISLNITVGFKTPSSINNITSTTVFVQAGLVNNSQPSVYLQIFQTSYSSNLIVFSSLINPNLASGTYGTRFQIKSDWNNSYVSLHDFTDNSLDASYNFTFLGDLTLKNVVYPETIVASGLPTYARDSTTILAIEFEVYNIAYETDIAVPDLNLYGILDIQGSVGGLNQSLPSITTSPSTRGLTTYRITVPYFALNPGDYQITIFTWTAIHAHLEIGELSPGFKVVDTFSPQGFIQLHEAAIIGAAIIGIILLYLNVKRPR